MLYRNGATRFGASLGFSSSMASFRHLATSATKWRDLPAALEEGPKSRTSAYPLDDENFSAFYFRQEYGLRPVFCSNGCMLIYCILSHDISFFHNIGLRPFF